jgi:hypothetical protein
MPRDDWAKDKAKDVGRKAVQEGRALYCGKRKARRPARTVKFNLPETGPFNHDTVLWFGKYKGRTLKQVPGDYLVWLTRQPASRNLRINDLCESLRQLSRGYILMKASKRKRKSRKAKRRRQRRKAGEGSV